MRKFLFVQAITPLHVGMGRGESSHVDLPVQRDEFGLPAIWASSLKGAMKSYALTKNPHDIVYKVFGKRPEDHPSEISGVTLLDARLFMIPARSLKGVWVYVTSPHMLRGFVVYAEVLGLNNALKDLKAAAQNLLSQLSQLKSGEAFISTDDILSNGRLFINEIPYSSAGKMEDLNKFMNMLKNIVDIPKTDLVVVNDDDIKNITNRSMLIQYRVRLTKEKTVDEGALWSEEYVPQFTLFYSGMICREDDKNQRDAICQKAVELVAGSDTRAYLWVGGKETIGKGLVKLYFI